MIDQKRDSDHPSKKDCNQPDCHKSKCWYVHKTLMPTSTDVITNQDLYAKVMEKNHRQYLYAKHVGKSL